MKKSLPHFLVFVVGLGATAAACAQVPPQPPGALPPPPPADNLPGTVLQTVQGIVARYLLNPYGEVDGLLLTDGTQVQFPPHMSDELVAAVRPGQPIRVQGFRESEVRIKANAISSGGATVVEHEPRGIPIPPRMRDAGLRELAAEGQVQQMLYGPRGEVNGLILSDASIVRFPPHVAYQLSDVLRVGRNVAATGFGTETKIGRALEATTITVDGQTPLVLYGRQGMQAPEPLIGPRPPRN